MFHNRLVFFYSRFFSITPLHSIFTRMGAYDNMFSSASTFKVELDECCKIIRGADSKSLVMLDGIVSFLKHNFLLKSFVELGRGTSTFDGMAVAAAVLHYLASRTNALSFFATHYSSLTREFASYPCIRSMHMSSVLDEERREVSAAGLEFSVIS
jgi:DNA mismatch repair protein MSH6